MNSEKRQLIQSFYFPLFFVALMWLVKGSEWYFEINLSNFGILPRNFSGLKGIFFSPFIHGDLKHLFNNTLPMVILGSALFYFYREIAVKVFFLIFLIGNIWLWALGREAYHIGASGIIYGLSSFLFFSGIWRKQAQLAVISMLVVFLYGSLVWGIFPSKEPVSFEGHLTGTLAGLVLSFYYKKEGPSRKKYTWEENPQEEDVDEENPYWELPEQPKEENESENKDKSGNINITYHFKKKEE
jgi:membrane associated rhomboid family serine protease